MTHFIQTIANYLFYTLNKNSFLIQNNIKDFIIIKYVLNFNNGKSISYIQKDYNLW